jgi:hypothetical protein
LADGDPRTARESMVALLALAHDRGREAVLTVALTAQMTRPEAGDGVVDVPAPRAMFAPVPATMPAIVVSYDVLLSPGAAA